jgi:hypothetical protein
MTTINGGGRESYWWKVIYGIEGVGCRGGNKRRGLEVRWPTHMMPWGSATCGSTEIVGFIADEMTLVYEIKKRTRLKVITLSAIVCNTFDFYRARDQQNGSDAPKLSTSRRKCLARD